MDKQKVKSRKIFQVFWSLYTSLMNYAMKAVATFIQKFIKADILAFWSRYTSLPDQKANRTRGEMVDGFRTGAKMVDRNFP